MQRRRQCRHPASHATPTHQTSPRRASMPVPPGSLRAPRRLRWRLPACATSPLRSLGTLIAAILPRVAPPEPRTCITLIASPPAHLFRYSCPSTSAISEASAARAVIPHRNPRSCHLEHSRRGYRTDAPPSLFGSHGLENRTRCGELLITCLHEHPATSAPSVSRWARRRSSRSAAGCQRMQIELSQFRRHSSTAPQALAATIAATQTGSSTLGIKPAAAHCSFQRDEVGEVTGSRWRRPPGCDQSSSLVEKHAIVWPLPVRKIAPSPRSSLAAQIHRPTRRFPPVSVSSC